jgi:short-subunit dehydrogenase
MRSQLSKTIWITGASSGLGRALAIKLAANGHRIIASARTAAALEQLALDSNIVAVPCDISDEQSLQRAIDVIKADHTYLDQVILNAGVCEYLDFPNPDWGSVRRVMEVNYFATVNCVRLALPLLMNASDQGRRSQVVAIASQVTAAPFPRAEAYGASKAALQYFFNSLRIDLVGEGIDVSVINPGFVDTPLTQKNNFAMPFLMDVDDAARRIIKRLDARPRSYSFPKRLSLVLLLSRLFPGLWQKLLSR